MQQTPQDCYVLFASHTHGWQLYEAVRAAGLAGRISPTPRAARASCGVALLINCDQSERVRRLAEEQSVPIEGIVEIDRQIDGTRDTFC